MLGFKDFSCARILLRYRTHDMISKGNEDGAGENPAQLFYSLAE